MMYACVSLFNSIQFCTCYLFYVSLLLSAFLLVSISISSRLVALRVCVYFFKIIDNDVYSNRRVTSHVRIANLVVTGSRCRGGIVNIRVDCSRVRHGQRASPMAL
jgi:hypothetical protein